MEEKLVGVNGGVVGEGGHSLFELFRNNSGGCLYRQWRRKTLRLYRVIHHSNYVMG